MCSVSHSGARHYSRSHCRSGTENATGTSFRMASSRPQVALFLVHEMTAAVLLPAAFVGFRAERLFLAVADRLDAVAADARCDQRSLYSIGTAIAQSQVVLGRATLVAVALDGEV